MNIENISVTMNRPTLTNLPDFALPPGYRLRWYQPGDEAAWVAIHMAADPYHHFDDTDFIEEFGADQTVLVARQAYLCPIDTNGIEDTPIGTATAWYGVDETRQSEGLVHWVAIHPDAQGQGLAKPLLSFICNRLHELGHHRAYLNTATVRIPAINLYLKFGFVPAVRGDVATTQRAWQQIRTQIDHPAIDQFLAELQEQGAH